MPERLTSSLYVAVTGFPSCVHSETTQRHSQRSLRSLQKLHSLRSCSLVSLTSQQ